MPEDGTGAQITTDDGMDIDSEPDTGFDVDEDGDGDPDDDDEDGVSVLLVQVYDLALTKELKTQILALIPKKNLKKIY